MISKSIDSLRVTNRSALNASWPSQQQQAGTSIQASKFTIVQQPLFCRRSHSLMSRSVSYANVLAILKTLPRVSVSMINKNRVAWLAHMGDKIIPALKKCAKHPDKTIREKAAFIFAMMGAKAKKAEPELATLSNDRQSSLARSLAMVALASIGKVSSRTKRIVLTKLRDPSWAVRINALRILINSGNIPLSAERDVRLNIKWCLSMRGTHGSMIIGKIKLLRVAVQALGKLSKPTRSSERILATALAFRYDATVRMNAAMALGERGTVRRRATFRAMEKAIKIDHPAIVVQVMYAFTRIGKLPLTAAKLITAALTHTNRSIRIAASSAIMHAPHAFALGAMPKIVKLLDDPEKDVQINALNTIAYLRPTGITITNKLIQKTKDHQWMVKVAAVNAIASLKIQDRKVVRRLLLMAKTEPWLIQQNAIAALVNIGKMAKASSVSLLKRMKRSYQRKLRRTSNAAAKTRLKQKIELFTEALKAFSRMR